MSLDGRSPTARRCRSSESRRLEGVNGLSSAVEDALESGGPLTRRVLAEIAGDFAYVEECLRRYVDGGNDSVSAVWLGSDLAVYVLVGAMARETPATADEVADVLGRSL